MKNFKLVFNVEILKMFLDRCYMEGSVNGSVDISFRCSDGSEFKFEGIAKIEE